MFRPASSPCIRGKRKRKPETCARH
jgi:hypothetical protein